MPSVPYRPQQIEFARLNLTYTVMSKRRLLALVKEGHVRGWDDPRMPTIAGLRRRGYTPEAIREFCEAHRRRQVHSTVDIQVLEGCLREDLNRRAPRVMGVLRPLKVVIENYPEGEVEELDAVNNPEDTSAGTRKVPFSRSAVHRAGRLPRRPAQTVFPPGPRARGAVALCLFHQVHRVVKDADTGEIVELHCTYDPATRGGDAPDGRKVKATLHWVSASTRSPRRCDSTIICSSGPTPMTSLQLDPDRARSASKGFAGGSTDSRRPPQQSAEGSVDAVDADEIEEAAAQAKAGTDWRSNLNPKSLEVIAGAQLEPGLAGAAVGSIYQFEHHGYFCVDPDSREGKLIFNRTVTLKDTWAKIEKKGQ